MTHNQCKMVKKLQRIWFWRRLFGMDKKQNVMTKQAEIELAGQEATKERPPLPTDESEATLPGQDGA